MLGGEKSGMKTAMEIKTIVQTNEQIGTIKGTARALRIAKRKVKKYLIPWIPVDS